MSAPISPERDLRLDLLRGVAVLYIVGYYHIQEIWFAHSSDAFAGWLARLALALFCFLSGYLLSARTTISSWSDVGRFYWRRIIKIYPLYLLALLSFVAVKLCPEEIFWRSVFLLPPLLNLKLLTLWFVGMIFLFYLVTPLYLWRPHVAKTWGLTVLLLAVLAWVKSVGNGIDPRLFPNLVAFAFGILLTQTSALRAVFFKPSLTIRLFSICGTVCLATVLWKSGPRDAILWGMVGVMGWFLVSLPGLISGSGWLCRFLPARGVEMLAKSSFILYLSHRIIYRLGEMWWHAPTPVWRLIYYVALLLPLALLGSYWGQRGWERFTRVR